MSYKSILVNLDIDGQVAPLVKLATDLARRLDARLVGFSAADIPPPIVSAAGMVIDAELMQRQREDIEQRLGELRAEFEGAVARAVETEWRGAVGNPTRRLIETARAADLIVADAPQGASGGSIYRALDLGSLVLNAGRPVLVAATGAERILVSTALIAWKDTREARRAVADALPLLRIAGETVIATVERSADSYVRDSIDDVAGFLSHHGVNARVEIIAEKDEGNALANFARSIHADLLVSGGYGHSRLREWVFGGVTRSLLDDSGLNRFMSS